MKHWIAYERDETGWPTDAFLIVMAETQGEARRAMADAITAHRKAEESLPMRARVSEIFIEAPTEIPADDPRTLISGSDGPVFTGFDDAALRPPSPAAARRLR